MVEFVLRFLIGGTLVSLFALTADVLKPKGFAGLFGAAPSVALATLGLTILGKGKIYAALEARSMIAGCRLPPLCHRLRVLHRDEACQDRPCRARVARCLGSSRLRALGVMAAMSL
jgi:hypothetical protein